MNKFLNFISCGALAAINSKLDTIISFQQKVVQMVATLTDLDNSIAQLTATEETTLSGLAASIAKDFAALTAKLNAPGQDYSAEVSSLASGIAALNTVSTSLAATDTAAQALIAPANPAIGNESAKAPVQPPFAKQPVNQSKTTDESEVKE